MISARHMASNHLCISQFCRHRPYFILIISFVIILLILLHQLPTETSNYNRTVRQIVRNQPTLDQDLTGQRVGSTKELCMNLESELEMRIGDLRKIKLSVSNELLELEQEKVKLVGENDNLNARNEKLLSLIGRSKTQLRQLELDISSNRRRKFDKTCEVERLSPIIFRPMDFQEIQDYSLNDKTASNVENITSSSNKSYKFSYSLCSLTKQFRFHLLTSENLDDSSTSYFEINKTTKIDTRLVREFLQNHPMHTPNVDEACLFVAILDGGLSIPTLEGRRNNLIINLVDDTSSLDTLSSIAEQAAIASSLFQGVTFRDNFDIVLPTIWQYPDNEHNILGSIPSHSPVERRYFASYFGSNLTLMSSNQRQMINQLEEILHTIHRNSFSDLFLFIYQCDQGANLNCDEERAKMVELSIFIIIFAHYPLGDTYSNDLIYLALSRGTIPVIICDEKRTLPFGEIIDWNRASIILPSARLPEIHFILRTYAASDLYQLKFNGRQIFERYLATMKQILDTTISLISIERFNYPPPVIEDVKTISYYSPEDLILDVNCTSSACLDAKTEILSSVVSSEILGPHEKSLPSSSFRRNLSLVLNSKYDLWNNGFYSPFKLYPHIPTDPIPPSEYKFYSIDQGYRPIADGMGGSGSEFSRSLGGDYPNEQFTLVLLTYERKNLMLKTLERLKGMPYLNKVLIVWNAGHHKPQPDIVWPDMGAPIVVVKVNQNSLNNRFLPFDAIETEAILSIDDDSPLRPDEIIFAFRVWRQSRDRIVGFPGRFHAWDNGLNSWVYNSNHSCELSMVLTGGAFFHKFYAYQYTYVMSPVIRSIVDKFMNCEDIAMNYLVSHLTRKPPIKVTSRWTFHCSECTSSLSEDDSHFRERHECLNTFASIYGYMPLMMTQSRSDSVLFKTRLPQNEQKCFKFV